MEQTTNSKVNLFKSRRDPISIHSILILFPTLLQTAVGKAILSRACISSLWQINTNYGAGHCLLIVFSFINDLINWVQYCEEFTVKSRQFTELISCSASIYDISFPSRHIIITQVLHAWFYCWMCIYTDLHACGHTQIHALTRLHTPGSIYNLQNDFPIVQCSGYCPSM